jgi:hypothetical protein
MPPRRNKLPPISVEWAKSLIGLSMRVPDDWWVGCSGRNLHDGRIVSFDISSQKWNLLLNSKEEPYPYLMAHDAVCIYSDEDSSTFNEYQLTACSRWIPRTYFIKCNEMDRRYKIVIF